MYEEKNSIFLDNKKFEQTFYTWIQGFVKIKIN